MIKVLVLEDNVSILEICESILGSKFDVVGVDTPEKALSEFNNSFNVLLTDHDLGGTMNGTELMLSLKERGYTFGTVLMSGLLNVLPVSEVNLFDRALAKPFEASDLFNSIEEVAK
ncbi:MAG: response regulator [Candidatus Komeilibacteria bacterium]